MSGHTPGPWVVIPTLENKTDISSFGIAADFNGTQCTIANVFDDGMEADADARLMASAPELLEAVRSLAEDLEDGHWSNTKRLLRVLIAKATGESA